MELPYLTGYSTELREQAAQLLSSGQLKKLLAKRYPDRHQVHSSKELAVYVQGMKSRHLRTAAPLGKVLYDSKLHAVHNALGLHTTTTRSHGSKVQKRREVRISGLFKDSPPEFLRMIVVHELAHMKYAEHDQDFYRMCTHMEPDYHQLELDLRLFLTLRETEREG